MIKRKKFANKSIKMIVTAEMACSKFMQQIGFMISRAPFVMESFMKEQTDGGQVLNIQVRYSPESSQQRGGEKAREMVGYRRIGMGLARMKTVSYRISIKLMIQTFEDKSTTPF